jgi:transglutaminase superfamily protein
MNLSGAMIATLIERRIKTKCRTNESSGFLTVSRDSGTFSRRKHMNRLKKVFLATLILTAGFLETRGEVTDKCFKKLPFGSFVTKSDVFSKKQTDAISKKLGTSLKTLSNTYLKVQGKPIQVNILDAKTSADAKKLYKTISAMKNNPAFCLIRDKKVIEFCNADVATATKTAYEIGFVKKPKQIKYHITAHVSTIEQADYMAFNRLFNVFLKTNTRNPNKESLAQIKTLSKGFTFGKSLALRAQPEQEGVIAYGFTPKPIKTEVPTNGRIIYSFANLPIVLGVPYVTLNANIVCNGKGLTPTVRKADKSLLAATSFWPVDDPQVQKLAKKITLGRRTPEAKVQAILEWLTPGKNIKPAGPTGSRWGVKKVLKQKYGHCWDSSDCFVTLARAAGIPSRQVAGWLYGTSGHVWAEVLIDGKGWQQVDPTGGGKLNCGIYHIPYFTSETGEMPILYLSMPVIEIVKTK